MPENHRHDLFISYAHEDERLRDKLVRSLASLARDGKIRRLWHDREIHAGSDRAQQTELHLESASLILLLISPDFIASDSCWNGQMQKALERHRSGTTQVVSIIIRPCDWQSAPFQQLQVLPRNGQPVSSWANEDEAFLDIARGVRTIVENPTRKAPTLSFTDEHTQKLYLKWKELQQHKKSLTIAGADTREVTRQILDVRRLLHRGPQLKPGDLLDDRFELIEVAGGGGFATVWKAWDDVRKCLMAIKVLHPHHGESKSTRERFFRGARKMAELQHQHVVRVFEPELEDEGWHFFVMEFVEGGNFEKAVLGKNPRGTSLTLEQKLAIVLQVGEALAVAHRQGLVHRDVKPANILLDNEWHAKLTDFDLVRAEDTTGFTATNAMMGTLLFTAPETLESAKDSNPSADVYSLGSTAVFALRGRSLPRGYYRDPKSSIAQLDCSNDVKRVLMRATALNEDDRYSSMGEFCDALRAELFRGQRPRSAPVVLRRPNRDHLMPGEQRFWEQAEMLLRFIPGGEFILGADDVDDYCRPVHNVDLSSFWIGEFPVTNEQFSRFLQAIDAPWKPEYWADERFNQPHQPVVGVNWQEAQGFCRWAGLVLPSEAQWEAAARGPDRRRYPWGWEEPDFSRARYEGNLDAGYPAAVGSYPAGIGPFGCSDQASNVWEWCADAWNPNAYQSRSGQQDPVEMPEGAVLRVVRGGSWSDPAWYLRAAYRDGWSAGDRLKNLGFRCVLRPTP